MSTRVVSGRMRDEDSPVETGLRPRRLDEYIGQDKVKQGLSISIEAAQARGETLDHVLLYGPPGLGKTTLATIIAAEMGVNLRVTAGPAIERAGDLVSILTNLKAGDVLFIDEIHRLNRVVEEVLYPAMEDYAVDIVLGKGPAARTMRLNLPRFTMVGATTRLALMTSPLRDRFGSIHRLDFYDQEAMEHIVKRSAGILSVSIDPEAATEIALRSRGTPRVANRLLRRVRDYAQVRAEGDITLASSATGARHARDRSTWTRRCRPTYSAYNCREVRRRSSRRRYPLGCDKRGDRYDPGRLRAVSDSTWLPAADPAGQDRDTPCVRTPLVVISGPPRRRANELFRPSRKLVDVQRVYV